MLQLPRVLSRRSALQRLALLAGATFSPWRVVGAEAKPETDALGPLLPRRTLGQTGLKVTMLACGGSHIGRPSEATAQAVIEAAIERGVRVFDTAQLYQNGGSEERLGRYLTPKYRAQVLVFTKTMAEDARTAREHLDGSLRRLKTDYLDLWQLHDVRSPEQAEVRVRGVLEVMLKAKADGKVRHIGFTGHATWRAHARVLQLTDQFETCLMPMNVADPAYESFILNILPTLVQRGMGVQAMKTLAADGLMGGRRGGERIIPDLLSIEDALRFVWSLPIGTLVSGMASVEHLRQNAAFATRFTAMTAAQRTALLGKVAAIARTGAPESGFKI